MINQIIEKYNNGYILLEDAVIELRGIKKELEAKIDAIKSFEKDNINGLRSLVSEYKADGYKGFRFNVISKVDYDYKSHPKVKSLLGEIDAIKSEITPIAKALVDGKIGVEVFKVENGMIGGVATDLADGDYAYDANGEAVMLPVIKYQSPYLMVEVVKEKKK